MTVLIANITWNPSGWTTPFRDPKAGHKYARTNFGHESLNFLFTKKGLDTDKNIYGFVQCTKPPRRFDNNGIIIFYSNNFRLGKGQIVGIYGNSSILREAKDNTMERL